MIFENVVLPVTRNLQFAICDLRLILDQCLA